MRSFFVLINLALISSCSTLSGIDNDFPKNWSPVKTSGGLCADISGYYENKGAASYVPSGGAQYLHYRFDLEPKFPLLDTEHDVIRLQCIDDKSVLVTQIRSGVPIATRDLVLSVEGYRLASNSLTFPERRESGADGTGGYTVGIDFDLLVSDDGSLIGRQHQVGVGAVLWLVPMAGAQTFWFKWSRAENPTDKAMQPTIVDGDMPGRR